MEYWSSGVVECWVGPRIEDRGWMMEGRRNNCEFNLSLSRSVTNGLGDAFLICFDYHVSSWANLDDALVFFQ